MKTWSSLPFWNTGPWDVLKRKLSNLSTERPELIITPDLNLIFKSLEIIDARNVKVVIMGQNPYPSQDHATGVAFSIPGEHYGVSFPPTLNNILIEYCEDLNQPFPSRGDLTPWVSQGVLLWNVIPICVPGYKGQNGVGAKPLSHLDWIEFRILTAQIIELLNCRYVVFALLGRYARRFKPYIDEKYSRVIETGHPSPQACGADIPFRGSRLFSSINTELIELGQEPVNWRLPWSPQCIRS